VLVPERARTPIHPRSPRFDFEVVPRLWFGGSRLRTHIFNGLSLLFPAGERFFVRSVRRYADQIDDPQLKEDIKGFFGQEGRHASAHERQFEALEHQGYDVRRFLRFYEWFAYGVVERIAPDELRLAATAACEHFTATMAHHALAYDDLAQADPTMRAFFFWHAVEEIEHKTVAYDVLQAVNPSYPLRIAGFALAATMLSSLWITGTLMLFKQDPDGWRGLLRELAERRRRLQKSRTSRATESGSPLLAYLRRSFHPADETRDRELARSYIAAAGL
jgi:predicted metal-dependent hydrolase